MKLIKINYVFFLVVLLCAAYSIPQSSYDIRLMDNWKFMRANPKDAQVNTYDDSKWTIINLPHTWNAFDGQDGGTDYYRGVGWYRKTFLCSSDYQGKIVYLKFDGAATETDVYVNGNFVGNHKGNFGAFCFDITPYIAISKENIIAVKVNNTKNIQIPPLRGDFTVFGGLYRGVHLLVKNPLSVSVSDYASSGVYLKQEKVSTAVAESELTAIFTNRTEKDETVSSLVTLTDMTGRIVFENSAKLLLLKNQDTRSVQKITLDNPHLWNGKNDPYQYTLTVTLMKDGKEFDKVGEKIGFRYYSIDKEEGFSLNGKPYQLYGVNRHQDRKDMGWAITSKEQNEDFQIINELGANCIRLAHYQHAGEFYDLCDLGGMVVWAELALVDDCDSSKEFLSNAKQQLTELIKQNYNHPSILFWSMENELVPDAAIEMYSEIVKELNSLAKQLDSSRLTTVATRSKYKVGEGMNQWTDIIGVNVYRGWYEKQAEDLADFLDNIHMNAPTRRFSISEYGAGGSIYQHELPTQKPTPKGTWHPEEYQSLLHEISWQILKERKFIWGTFIWNMFDFAADQRSEGDMAGMNDKGLVTYDRKVRKDAFYFYKAQWTDIPMVHIASKRFSPRKPGNYNIKVYTNCSDVELSFNGVISKLKVPSSKVLEIQDKMFNLGKNEIKVIGVKNGIESIDTATIICDDNVSVSKTPKPKRIVKEQ